MNAVKTRRGDYEIILNDDRTLLTSSRANAAAEVKRLLDAGVSETDIYATYGGDNYKQARMHLLLPEQN